MSTTQCPRCQFDSPANMKFCGMCGARLTQICFCCGFANPLTFRFCGQCGAALAGSSDTEDRIAPSAQVGLLPPEQDVAPTTAPDQVTPARQPDLSPGERRLATILLVDVRNSTLLLERLGNEAWVELMNQVLQLLESEVYRLGGQVNQFRGDGLLAFFGATVTRHDDAERAVLAGLAMHQAIRPLDLRLAEQHGLELRVRVGINSGEVITTNVGDRQQYSEDTLMGEAITLAARLEAAAEPGTVLVSENTFRLVQEQFDWLPLGHLSAKGLSQPIAVYRPLNIRVEERQSSRLEIFGLSLLSVGRDQEQSVLNRHIEDLRRGRGSIVLITGEEGMGKSHLVAQARRHDQRDRALLSEMDSADPIAGLNWFQGRSRSYEQSRPYGMWADMAWSWLNVRGQSAQEAGDSLRRHAESLWGEQMNEHYPYLAAWLALPLEEELLLPIKQLGAEKLRRQIAQSVQALIQAWMAQTPLVLAFEDVHWADASSLELLYQCLPLCEQGALLWLLVARNGRTPITAELIQHIQTDHPALFTHIALLPLSAAQSGEMIDYLIGPETLPERTRSLIIERSEGNPYYIEELIRSLIQGRILVRSEETGQWKAKRSVISLDLPDTLRSLLLSGMDDLSPVERRVLQIAAVIGPVFWQNVLAALSDRDDLEQHLAGLQCAQMIYERGQVPQLGQEYAFKSALMHQVAYDSLLSSLRVTYHLHAAEYLERFFGLETLPAYYALLAHHYRCAGQTRKELFYTLQAAEQANAVYANAEALEHYTHALELLDRMEADVEDDNRLYAIRSQRFEVINGRLQVLLRVGRADEGRPDARMLLQLAGQLADDPTWMVDALLQQPGVATWQDRQELEAGIPLAQQALSLAQTIGDGRREALCRQAIARQQCGLAT